MTLNDVILRLLVSLVIGIVIGTEREYKTKAAGFRTVILITLGSTFVYHYLRIYGWRKRSGPYCL
jgi:uncharacterized membrane protein YhiD involved in acid resistance